MLRNWMASAVLILGVLLGGAPLMANSGPAMPASNLVPVQPVPAVTPAVDDFSDSEFAQADQAELGETTGGDALGFLVFVLIIVLIVLLILWLIREGHLRR